MIGHMRSYKYNYESLQKYILNNNKYDIFIHTWKYKYPQTPSWSDKYYTKINREEKIDRAKIISYYNPKILLLEEQKNIKCEKKHDNISINFQLYALNRLVYEFNKYIEKHEIKYDIIIKTRPDIKYIDDFLYTYDNSNIIVLCNKFMGGCDIIYFGNHEIMLKALKIYDNVNKLKKLRSKPESIYIYYFKKILLLNIKMIGKSYYKIIRF